MDNPGNERLFKALEALRGDIGSLREGINSGRTEASAQHLEITEQIGGLSDRLTAVDARIATMEAKHHGRYRAAGALMVGTVAALARAALLGK